jgi:hypothetical protein
MNDQMRVSDAERDRVTDRLREHFAAGRLTSDELEERITAALHAKTEGDLRQVMTDLPEPAGTVLGTAQQPWAGPRSGPGWAGNAGMVPGSAGRPYPMGPPWMVRRRGPRLLPLVLVALIVALVLPGGGFVLFAFLRAILLFWLVASLAGIAFALARRRRVHRS